MKSIGSKDAMGFYTKNSQEELLKNNSVDDLCRKSIDYYNVVKEEMRNQGIKYVYIRRFISKNPIKCIANVFINGTRYCNGEIEKINGKWVLVAGTPHKPKNRKET